MFTIYNFSEYWKISDFFESMKEECCLVDDYIANLDDFYDALYGGIPHYPETVIFKNISKSKLTEYEMKVLIFCFGELYCMEPVVELDEIIFTEGFDRRRTFGKPICKTFRNFQGKLPGGPNFD